MIFKNESTNLKNVYDIVNAGSRNRFTIKTNSGHLLVHKVGGGGYEADDYGRAPGNIPANHQKAISKILSIFKSKYGIEIGKLIKFSNGIMAEQTVSAFAGKSWALLDELGNNIAMYYPKDKFEIIIIPNNTF